jgi:hypothetical protein
LTPSQDHAPQGGSRGGLGGRGGRGGFGRGGFGIVDSLRNLTLTQSFYRAAVLNDDGVERPTEVRPPFVSQPFATSTAVP